METEVNVLRESLFRLLGKCLVRTQAVELMLKRLLAVRTLRGTVEELEVQLASRHLDYQTNTLGTLVKEVLASYVVPECYEHPDASEPPPPIRLYFHFHSVISMPDERLAKMRQLFTNLVSTRNGVVHHLAELFPLGTDDGCTQALEFLGEFEKVLEEVGQEVRSWAESHDKARQEMTLFMQTPDFENLVFDGILPDGTVNWEVAGVVRALRAAASSRNEDTWMPLEDAIVWIRREAPLQIPSRYNCATYRQVIHESRAFEVKRASLPDGTTQFLYRSK